MKRRHRILAILMSLALVLTYMPAGVFAAADGEEDGRLWTLEQDRIEYRQWDPGEEVYLEAYYEYADHEYYDELPELEYRWLKDGEIVEDWAPFEEGSEWTGYAAYETGVYECQAREAGQDEAQDSVTFNVMYWSTGDGSESYELGEGKSVTLRPEIIGEYSGNLSYAWYREDELKEEEVLIEGASAEEYTTSEAGKYICRITETVDGEEVYSESAHFYISKDRAWWAYQKDDIDDLLLKDGKAEMSVAVSGDHGKLKYTWQQQKKVEITGSDDDETEIAWRYVTIPKETGSSMIAAEAGSYRCCVQDADGKNDDFVYFNVLTWRAYARVSDITMLKNQDHEVLALDFEGNVPNNLRYTWSKGDDELPGENETTLTIDGAGEYSCTIDEVYSDEEGEYYEYVTSVYFYVDTLDTTWNAVPKGTDGDVERKAGKKAALEVEIVGEPEGELTFQWYNCDYDEEKEVIKGASGRGYETGEEGSYMCRVTDSNGDAIDVYFYVYNESVEIDGVRYMLMDNEASASGTGRVINEASIRSEVKFSNGKSYPVTAVWGFNIQPLLSKVIIPASVKFIYEGAFVDTALTSITIPATVTDIGDHAVGYKEVEIDTGKVDEDGDRIYEYEYRMIPNFVIYGESGSEAEKYAKSNGIKFVAVAGESDLAKTRPGTVANVSGATVKVLTNVSSKAPGTVAYTKAPNKKSVSVPATVKINNKTFKVTQVNANAFKGKKIRTVTIGANVSKIAANAFKGSKATKVVLKTKLLKKAGVKKAFKGSKVNTVQVKVGNKKTNKKFVKSYKKIFTKKVTGAKVTVK